MMGERADRTTLDRFQLAALQKLLAEVGQTNPFWRTRIRAAGLDGGCESLQQFREQLPPVTKAELVTDQYHHPPYGTNLTYPLARYTRFHQTSATSGGAPLRWLDTPESWQWMLENWKQVYRAAEVGPGDRVYFAFSFGPFLGFWTAFEAAAQMGCLCLPGGGVRSAGHLATMRENQATVLCCTPTYARRLAEIAREQELELHDFQIRRILVAGEPGGSIPAVRTAIERDWPQARVFDHHGMTEVGPVSYQCPRETGTLIVIEQSYLAEIVDPTTLQPAPPGQTGELILTTLGRYGSPLIRYRTGDLVRADTTLQDRWGVAELGLAGGILGRADDMVVVRGVNVYPSAIDDLCAGFPQIAEYRVRIGRAGALVNMQLDVEPVDTDVDGPALARQVKTALKTRLMLTIPVTPQPPGTLPRFEMKSRRWQITDE